MEKLGVMIGKLTEFDNRLITLGIGICQTSNRLIIMTKLWKQVFGDWSRGD